MKRYPPRKPARHVRVPAFVPVPTRARADGWTPARQAEFLAALALTRSVSAAARRVSMARETAYRLRRRAGAESFAAAWDAALGRVASAKRKVTPEERARRALDGLLKPHFWRGEHVLTVRKADNSALLSYLAQLDRPERAARRGGGRSQDLGARSACHRKRSQSQPVRGEEGLSVCEGPSRTTWPRRSFETVSQPSASIPPQDERG